MAASSSSSQEKYDVFLSFRGKDTRDGFTGYLYHALCEKKIQTYMDQQNLERGDKILPTLVKVIQESKICIIILSKNFATSTWCLDEVVQILKCKRNGNIQHVIPIFYYIEPSIVRKQEESYAVAFARHEERFQDRMDMVQQWRDALNEVAALCGYDSKTIRPEYKLVREIVGDILSKLHKHQLTSDHFKGHLIGIEEPIKEIESLLSIGSMDVRIIGIWGMGGIGKTTLASILFRMLSYSNFEGFFFLEGISEYGHRIYHLRNTLFSELFKDETIRHMVTPYGVSPYIQDRLCRMKVLIVLDGLDSKSQYLLEGYEFGAGSRIIVTTRDLQVLRPMTDKIYEVKGLNYLEALKLFHLYAFRQNSLTTDYETLSERVANYANGNPLALKVLGSSLNSKSIEEWESALNRLEIDPNQDIQKVLRISYEGLGSKRIQSIFLDFACMLNNEFYRGDEEVEAVLNHGEHSDATIGISVLIDNSLLINCDNRLSMHALIRQMGRAIVCDESKEPGNRSRLWKAKEICHVLERNTGSSTIEGILLDQTELEKDVKVSPTAFAKMYNLRFLRMHCDYLYKGVSFYKPGYRKRQKKFMYLPQGLECLPDELIFFQWDLYRLKYFPSNFSPENLDTLILRGSQLEVLWDEVQPLEKLRKIDLSFSEFLTQIPNLSRAINLEDINLRGCTSLVQVPSYFQNLHKLKFLNMSGCHNLEDCGENLPMSMVRLYLSGCKRLKSLPESIWKLKYLEYLDLFNCHNMGKFPEILDRMECLVELKLGGTGIEGLPESIENLVRLRKLDMSYCERLKSLPESIWKLKYLESLTLSDCGKLEKIPQVWDCHERLRGLTWKLSGNLIRFGSLLLDLCKGLKSLPESIWKLKYLKWLTLSACKKLEKIPKVLNCNGCLGELVLSGTGIKGLPESIGNLVGLRRLNLDHFERFKRLPEIFLNLKVENLILHDCPNLGKFPEIISGTELKELNLGRCRKIKFLPNTLSKLHHLTHLYLNECSSLEELPPLPLYLEELEIRYCEKLKLLSELPRSLNILDATGCTSLETISSWRCPIFKHSFFGYSFENCLNLDHNSRNNLIVRHTCLPVFSALYYVKGHEIVYPGDEIPEWFSYQTNGGNSINIDLPPNWFKYVHDLRFVICVVVGKLNNFEGSSTVSLEYDFILKTNTSNSDDCLYNFGGGYYYNFGDGRKANINSHHVLIAYDRNMRFSERGLEGALGTKWSSICRNVTKASFRVSFNEGVNWDIQKCGIAFVNKNDTSKRRFGECSAAQPNVYEPNNDSHPQIHSKEN